MSRDTSENDPWLAKAMAGDREALGELLGIHADRLERMVRLRLDPRLARRVDAADIMQEVHLEAIQRFDQYRSDPDMPFFLWLRFLTRQRLAALYRHHFEVQARDRRREVRLTRSPSPEVTSAVFAAQLIGTLTTPGAAAERLERHARLQKALDAMDPLDREVLALRHYEQLGNAEVATELGINESAASKRYIRALERLRGILADAT